MSTKFKKVRNLGHIIAQSEGYAPRSKTNFLDYTFMSHRNKLSFTNFNLNFENYKPKNYLFDLIQTFEINTELLTEIIKTINDEKERNEIMLIYNHLKNNYQKKKNIVEDFAPSLVSTD